MKNLYTTQMDAAKKGIFTSEMKQVLENESISRKDLMENMAQGSIAVPETVLILSPYMRD